MPVAAEVTGGDIVLSYSAFTDEGDLNRTSLQGAVEYSFGNNFAAQADLGLHNFGLSNEDTTTLTLHGIYHLDDSTSLGAFIGRDRVVGESLTLYGVEAGRDLGRVDVEGYIAGFDDSGIDGIMLGGKGRYAYSEQIGFGASFDYGRIDSSTDLTRLGINADYKFGNGLTLAAEVGQLDANAFGFGGAEAYAKVSVGFEFGAKRGASFDNRSLTRLLPGF
jgi:hypothetical protein